MERMIKQFYDVDHRLFRNVNQYFQQKYWNFFFRNITHCGGATFTISTVILLLIFGTPEIKTIALASAISLTISHIPVAILKKMYPRRRPYLVLDEIYVTDRPLKDHSFPSGHTTAIFSIVIPFALYNPIFAVIFLPLAVLVGISRMYLGLHYPSDVIVGILLGSTTGILSLKFVEHYFLHLF